MKENSVEEDIINAEHFINSIKTDKDYKDENGWHGYYNREIVELARILEHILSDYKRVLGMNEVLLEENEKIKNGRNRLFEYATAQQTTPEMLNKILRENYISKDKIEEILDGTEITDFNSLVETFLEIKKLLESE